MDANDDNNDDNDVKFYGDLDLFLFYFSLLLAALRAVTSILFYCTSISVCVYDCLPILYYSN